MYLNNEVTTLAESGVQDGTTLQLVLRLRGGDPGGGTAMFGMQQSLTQCDADGSANAMDDCASTTTKCGPHASEFGCESPVALETVCVLGNATLKAITTRERLSFKLQVGETKLSALPWSVAGVLMKRGDADGNAHALACTAPQCGLRALTVGLDSAVVTKMGKITTRERSATLTHMNITSLSTVPCSIEEGVQESGTNNGSENPLADCASSASPCNIGARAIGVDAMVV